MEFYSNTGEKMQQIRTKFHLRPSSEARLILRRFSENSIVQEHCVGMFFIAFHPDRSTNMQIKEKKLIFALT